MSTSNIRVKINTNSELYDNFLLYLGEKNCYSEYYLDDILVRKNGQLCVQERYDTIFSDDSKAFKEDSLDSSKIGFKFGFTGMEPQTFTTEDGEEFSILHYEDDYSLSSNGVTMKHATFYIMADTKSTIQKVICEVNKCQPSKPKDKIRIFIKGHRCSWKLNAELPKRDISSVFHPEKESIVSDIDEFMNNESDYIKYGMPYKRNYLFHGKPGTGKTSFITSIASKYDLDIYFLTFDSDLDDKAFKTLVSSISNQGILVIEDIHNVHFGDGKGSKPIGMSAVLNTLDGLARKNRLLSFMTTNFYENLESVLTRPGRIDKIVEFKLVGEAIFEQMITAFFPNLKEGKADKYEKLWEKIRSNDISPAILQKYLFENRNSEDIVSRESLQILNNLLDQYKTKDQYASQHLYS